ncbi:hypothetical protein ACSU6B_23450 [Neobacillus sp. C211]|uniref:hypothetical protein n=1 Tax=unclassified Neobacillus TaxID=2675272 RepID=UPI003978B115
MYTERQAIQDELHDNRRQITELRDRNGDLLKRLREIDERDMKDDVSYDALNSLTSSLTEVIDKISDLIPFVPATAVIEHIANQMNEAGQQVVVDNKEAEPQKVVQEAVQKAAQEDKLHKQPEKYFSAERTCSVIFQIVQEKGRIKTKDLEAEFYKRTGKRYVNFSEQIRKAMEQFPSLERVGRGAYQVKSKKEDQMINPIFLNNVENRENKAAAVI